MSGFCGWFGGEAPAAAEGLLARMAERLPRHGPCVDHDITGPGFGLALRAHPAMGSISREQSLAAVIEGYPVWSDPALAGVAREQGQAAALAAAYRTRGAALLEVLRGPFSFALVDLEARRALLAIDRFGIQTLCHTGTGGEGIAFASTTDALRAHPRVGATLSIQAIHDYLYFVDRVPAPETIYREQRKLAPGEYLLIEPGRRNVKQYWRMPYSDGDGLDSGRAAEELRRHMRSAVERSMAGEDPDAIGAFLSGGLDSSSVVGFAAEQLPGKLKAFTIGFPVEGFDETHFAEVAASHFGVKHQIYYMQPQDVVEVLQRSVGIHDEPFANLSMIPSFVCARLAREAGAEVLLAGDGGDELFAGNDRYAKDQVFDGLARLPGWLLASLRRSTEALPSAANRLPLVGKVARFIGTGAKSVPERMISNVFEAIDPRGMFSDAALAEIEVGATRRLADGIYGEPEGADKVQRMMHFDLRITLADSDLRKINRMCELAGVRVRYPFLVEEVAEFAARLPTSLLMEAGMLRHFYKKSMAGFLPQEIIDKQKHGFGLPYMDFLRSYAPLQSLMCDGLASLRKRGLFRIDFLDGLIARTRSNALVGWDAVVWDLLILELWLQSRQGP